jgi:PKD repeat protein
LSLNRTSGLISGTPTQISSGYSVGIEYPQKFIKFAAGQRHSLGLKSDGTVVAWGASGEAVLQVPAGLSGVTAIASTWVNALALKSDGTVVSWGGMGSANELAVPANLSGVIAISSGYSHSLALKNNGTVVAWGNNNQGQTAVPSGLSGVAAIAAGESFSLALKSNGTVVAWGRNLEGQTAVPSGLSGVTAIAAGVYHSLALKSNGTVVSWGMSSGTVLESSPAVPVGLSGVVAIAAGQKYSLALKNDGTVVHWGMPPEWLPSSDLSGVTALFGGPQHIFALKNDETAIVWGMPYWGGGLFLPPWLSIARAVTSVNFTINPGAPIITANQSFSGKVGTAFSATPTLADPTNRPATGWAATGLPAGLSINASTGAITGTPQDSGTSTITLTATGSGGADTETITIAIAVGPPKILWPTPPRFTAKVGEQFSATILLDDPLNRPATSFVWWPRGLEYLGFSLSNSGQISGTPTSRGSFTTSFRAIGPGGSSGALDPDETPRSWSNGYDGSHDNFVWVTFTIAAGVPIITANQSAQGVVNFAFAKTFSLVDAANRPASSWAVTGLPPGLSISASTGAITGTPGAAGSYQIFLTATGEGGVSATTAATITISAGAPIIDPGQSFAGKVGVAFPAVRPTIQDATNRAPSAWAIGAGSSLPAGLQINSDSGVISGTPLAVGTFSVNVRASNSNGFSEVAVGFTITPGAPILLGETINATAGSQISRFVGRADVVNRPITSFSASGLPAWLSLDAASGRLSGVAGGSGVSLFTVTATGPGGTNTATITINVGVGVGYYEVRNAETGVIYLRTAQSDFVISNLEPATTYNLEIRAYNGGGPSAPQVLQVTTLPLAGRPASSDRIRLLPVSEKFTSSSDSKSLPPSVSSADAFMKNLWVKKTAQATAQFNTNAAAFNGQFVRGEDIVDMDWVLDGLPAAQYDRSQEKVLLTEGVTASILRYDSANFAAAYGGEYIDGQIRQTILHARINTTDARPGEWITEAFLLPGAAFRLRVLFYTNMFNTILRLGGPTLHYATYKVPHTFEAQEARSGRGLTQLVNGDGAQTFVRTLIDCGEEEHVVFAIKNPGGMQETQTSLIVVAER